MKPYNPVERIKELELEIRMLKHENNNLRQVAMNADSAEDDIEDLEEEITRLKAREAELEEQIEAVKLFIQQLVAGLQKTDSLS